MILLVTGDRHWKNHASVVKVMQRYHKKYKLTLVIQGGAEGADGCAFDAASLLGIDCATFHANWTKFGRAAGPIRNNAQLKFLLLLKKAGKKVKVIAFHKDIRKSKGTKDMVTRARKANLPVKVYKK